MYNYWYLGSECTGTVGDPKPARTSPYDGTEPVMLLRPEDMRARPDHQLPMHSCVNWEIYNDNNEWQNKIYKIRQVIN